MRSDETPSDGPNGGPDPDESPPDLEISASVSAREVTFRRVPHVETTFGPDGESSVDSGRENLPDRVEPGVTHRGVRAFYRAVSRPWPHAEGTGTEPGTGPS